MRRLLPSVRIPSHSVAKESAMNLRPAALATGPLTLLSLLLLVVTFVVEGFDSDLAIAKSPYAIAASVCAMVGLMLLVLALFRLSQEFAGLREGVGQIGVWLAMIGTLLGIGGAWSMVFVLPGLAHMDGAGAEIAGSGIPLVQTGFIASYIIMAIGWLLTGVGLRHSGDVPRWAAVALIVGAIFCIAPLPSRFFLIALVVTAIESKILGRRTIHSHVAPTSALV
jgi:hypothetical protein